MSDARPQRPRTFGERALSQLTLVRYREFFREWEAIFWVFAFPVLLAAGLAVAFRNRPQETLKIGVLDVAPGALAVRIALEKEPALNPELLSDTAGMRRLATGDIAIFVVPRSATEVTYRFDD